MEKDNILGEKKSWDKFLRQCQVFEIIKYYKDKNNEPVGNNLRVTIF